MRAESSPAARTGAVIAVTGAPLCTGTGCSSPGRALSGTAGEPGPTARPPGRRDRARSFKALGGGAS
ncbi:hypothetical protein AB0K47_08580 [Streptomyces tirandamycinicus]|uniref:hypothetical protein n=1 Tax=Streptomyces tirandamycinicus TaxID=2174846 RepID=UPI003420FECE